MNATRLKQLITGAALVVGVIALASACGSSSSSGGGSGGGSGSVPAHQNGGKVAVALAGNIDYVDPALAYYQVSWQLEYSTCVKLTDYPQLPGAAGRIIQPEAASGWMIRPAAPGSCG